MSASGGGSCTRSSTAVAFNQATSCNTLQAAFNACQAGDKVGVLAGSYGSQPITGVKASPGCVFDLSASGTVASLTPSFDSGGACRSPCAQWVEFDNGAFSPGWNITSMANGVPTHVTFRNLDMTGEAFFKGGSFVSVIGGQVHGFDAGNAPTAMHIEGQISGGVTQTNFLVQGVDFHDITNSVSGNHFELIRIDENASFVTVRGNKFHNSQENSSTIFITSTSGGAAANWPHDITIESNFFGTPADAFYSLNTNSVVATCANWSLLYNSFGTTPFADQGCTKSNFLIQGNAGGRGSSCVSGATYTANVWQWSSNSPCGGSDTIAIGTAGNTDKLGFTNPANGDMQISGTSPLIGKGGSGCYGIPDFYGTTLTTGTCNAGANQ